MPNLRFAEWILGLVSAPDRAASTVGDLAEAPASRGSLWFWSALLRTAAAHVWHAMADRPARIAGVAAGSVAIDIVATAVWAFVTGIVFFASHYFTLRQPDPFSFAWRIWFTAPPLVASFLIGRLIARLAPRRELAACLAYVVLLPAVMFAAMLLFTTLAHEPQSFLSLSFGASKEVPQRLPAFAGAAWALRRRAMLAPR